MGGGILLSALTISLGACRSDGNEPPVLPPDPEPGTTTLDRVAEASYYGTAEGTAARYRVVLSDTETRQDDSGRTVPAEEGTVLALDLWAAPSADPDDAALPEGEYELSSDRAGFTLYSPDSYWRIVSETSSGGGFADGRVTVIRKDGAYVVTAALTLSGDGDEMNFVYSGALKFTDMTGGEPDPETIVFDRSSNAAYFGDLNGTGAGGYGFILTDVPLTYDEAGQPVPAEPGTAVTFDLWGPLSALPDEAVLPDGEYVLAEDYAGYTFHPDYTYYREVHSDGSRSSDNFSAGTVTVARDGGDYVIEALLTPTKSGVQVKYVFRGPIEFKNQSGGMGLPPMEHDADISFSVARGQYFGRKGLRSDSYVLNLYTSEPDGDGNPSQPGYMMSIDLLTEQSEDMHIAPGVYPIEVYGNHMTCLNGLEMYMFGFFIPAGTYCMDWNGTAGTYGLAASEKGTVTVSRAGDVYTLDIEYETTKGYTVRASYSGGIPMEDKSKPDPEPGGPYSTLTSDYEVDLDDAGLTTKEFQYWGDFYKSGTGNWTIRLRRDGGDGMQFELFAPLGAGFPIGTFRVSEGHEEFTYLPGIMQDGACTNTWYIQYSAAANKAPAKSGTIEITEGAAENVYTISFDLYDDLPQPNRFYGSWTGEVVVSDHS